jgi:dTDP-4-dehydrorhamnose 3,5-epimerase
LLIVEPQVFADERGLFCESYHEERYAAAGIGGPFVQDNFSRSRRGVVRGLHYQLRRPQGKLVWVLRGETFDVTVDLRRRSPTFGKAFSLVLSEANRRQLYAPPGFAHGLCALSELAEVAYKCTDYYAPEDERALLWNDPAVAVAWPVADPILSEKDRRGRRWGRSRCMKS